MNARPGDPSPPRVFSKLRKTQACSPHTIRAEECSPFWIAVLVAAFAALAYGPTDAVISLCIFGLGNTAVIYTLQVWNNRRR